MIDKWGNRTEEGTCCCTLLLNFGTYIKDKIFQKLLLCIVILPYEAQNVYSTLSNFPVKKVQ